MVMEIRVTGMKEVRNFMSTLPKNIRQEVSEKGIIRITRLLKNGIKRSFTLRGYGQGPSSTGYSLKSIGAHKTKGGGVVRIKAPWLQLIENKKTSSHFVSSWTIRQHQMHPGSASTMFQEAPRSERNKGDPIWWTYKGQFVKPAVEKFRPRIVPELEKDLARAISKSGGKIRI